MSGRAAALLMPSISSFCVVGDAADEGADVGDALLVALLAHLVGRARHHGVHERRRLERHHVAESSLPPDLRSTHGAPVFERTLNPVSSLAPQSLPPSLQTCSPISTRLATMNLPPLLSNTTP